MERLIRDFGLTEEQAAAVAGNLGHESGGLEALQEIKPTVKGSRGSYGWAQWTGPRRRAFETFAREQGLSPASDEANYRWMATELRGSHASALRSLKRASGLRDQVVAFERTYEAAGIKHYDSRQAYAERALAAYRRRQGN